MPRPFPGIVSTTVVATSVILFLVYEGGERDATEEGSRKGREAAVRRLGRKEKGGLIHRARRPALGFTQPQNESRSRPDPEFECASQLRVFHAKVKDTRTRFRSFLQPSRARARARYSKSLTCDSSISARLRLTRERGLFIRRAFPGVRPLNPFFSSEVSGNFAQLSCCIVFITKKIKKLLVSVINSEIMHSEKFDKKKYTLENKIYILASVTKFVNCYKVKLSK